MNSNLQTTSDRIATGSILVLIGLAAWDQYSQPEGSSVLISTLVGGICTGFVLHWTLLQIFCGKDIALIDRLPKTADGYPIVPGNTIYFDAPQSFHFEPDQILESKVILISEGTAFPDYQGTHTIGTDEWEGGNLECYARRQNVPT